MNRARGNAAEIEPSQVVAEKRKADRFYDDILHRFETLAGRSTADIRSVPVWGSRCGCRHDRYHGRRFEGDHTRVPNIEVHKPEEEVAPTEGHRSERFR